jgi:hypothetical protein
MTTEKRSAREAAMVLAPPAERGEHWWPVALAIIVAAGLHVADRPGRARHRPRHQRALASLRF